MKPERIAQLRQVVVSFVQASQTAIDSDAKNKALDYATLVADAADELEQQNEIAALGRSH